MTIQTDAQKPIRAPVDTPLERRPPWWLLGIAASYLALLSLIPLIVIWGPADLLGLRASFEGGRMLLRSVAPDSLPDRAGLRAGDQILAIDGRPIRGTHDWGAVNANLEVGRAQRWEVLRSNEPIELEITPERATWDNRRAAGKPSSCGRFCTWLRQSVFSLSPTA